MTIGVSPNRQPDFVDGRKNLKFEESFSEYVTSSLEEYVNHGNGVHINNPSRENEVDLYVLEAVPKSQEKGSSLDAIVRNEREIELTISPILLGNGLTNKGISEFQLLLQKSHHLFTKSYKDLKKVTLEEHKVDLLSNMNSCSKGHGK